MMDDAPKPKDPEIIAGEKICQQMREIAESLPKPSGEERREAGQFGNNFYLLFTSINKNNPVLVEIYLHRAEKLYGEKWRKFLEENSVLINQMGGILKELEIDSELLTLLVKLYRNQKTVGLGDKIDEELNLKSIGNDIWNKLNPLLRQASGAMTRCEINPEEFYG